MFAESPLLAESPIWQWLMVWAAIGVAGAYVARAAGLRVHSLLYPKDSAAQGASGCGSCRGCGTKPVTLSAPKSSISSRG